MKAMVRTNTLRSLVNIAPVANCSNLDKAARVVDAVHDAIIADADPPHVMSSTQLSTARWARIFSQSLQSSKDSLEHCTVERLQLLSSGAHNLN